ncbi:LOW QUALITY PROTEIN: spermatogenesis-associated protein 16-like [Osmerus mordax]|uniref:LOW QUALITY PROTEIN: spermatogenesis-associated protein 16-like n=1 Tax=Osmerus mordax TaxID=8014 RepID=UPI00350F4AAB
MSSLEVANQAHTDKPNQSSVETANTATGSQTAQQTPCLTKRSRAKMDNSQPKRTKTDCGNGRDLLVEGRQGVARSLRGLSPRLPRISLKRLLEVENTLVHGEERLGAKSPTAPSSSAASQLMCQGCEIGGPASGPNLSFLPQIDKWLVVAIQAADSYYQQRKYGVAASRLTTALELCSKGAALVDQLHADHEDISSLVSYLEARLVVCYLKLKRPELALNHAHRSIHLNPAHFRNHLRQAAAFRLLGEPRAAARSAMIADWLYWLSGGSERHLSRLIKLYWQAMLEEAITLEEGVSVMFSPAPCFGEALSDVIARAEEEFRKRHPTFTEYLYTGLDQGLTLPLIERRRREGGRRRGESLPGAWFVLVLTPSPSGCTPARRANEDPSGDHVLPQTRDWNLGLTPNPSPSTQPQTSSPSGSSSRPQAFLLTLGFRRREEGVFLEKLQSRSWPSFTEAPQGSWRPGEVERSCDMVERSCDVLRRTCDVLRRRVLPILDLINSTKLTVGKGVSEVERLTEGLVLEATADTAEPGRSRKCSEPHLNSECDWSVVCVKQEVCDDDVVEMPEWTQTSEDAGFFPGSGVIQRLQYADFLGQLQRGRERTVTLQQVLAELSVAPYLQEVNETDAKLVSNDLLY